MLESTHQRQDEDDDEDEALVAESLRSLLVPYSLEKNLDIVR
jgi:hypothetical protein